jgi:tetratricopeptide (TPR) repeat protein
MAGALGIPGDEPIRIFVSFSYRDEHLMQELLKHLRGIDRLGQMEIWHGRKIKPGERFSKEIREHLESADLFLLLISPDFIDSKYCYEIEAMKALERAEAGQCIVIPVMLRPTFWDKLPLSARQALPKNGQPVVTWPVQDEALRDVVQGVWTIVQDLLSARGAGRTTQVGASREQREAVLPIVSAQQAEQIQSASMPRQTGTLESLECCKYGDILRAQGDYEGAFQAYERAILLEPTLVEAYLKKSDLHQHLGQRLAALEAYAHAQELMDE